MPICSFVHRFSGEIARYCYGPDASITQKIVMVSSTRTDERYDLQVCHVGCRASWAFAEFTNFWLADTLVALNQPQLASCRGLDQ